MEGQLRPFWTVSSLMHGLKHYECDGEGVL
jgi:hypothetical protein